MESITRCFRNQVLLGSEGNHNVFVRGRRQRTNEDANNSYQCKSIGSDVKTSRYVSPAIR